ncbi:peptidyl-prolyl cis-trans isomerase [Neisseria leonii]|uniref:peptidylprolyl isomerase n=1 Tax=Neisseria leonii TaxID=2995413 RepID=A0A9X4IF28_9NEIS|nr:peptidyl-prolyl cis-trans isomerase [Neisseria sp. 51.81]MDD9328753.1 peptidyl-prolyl cis-trans isomerase [Neisseria sp. 51.81]
MKKTYLAALMMTALSGSLMAQTLVTVNGTKIDSSEIDRQVRVLQQTRQAADSPALRNELLQRTVTRTIVAQEARRLKLDQSAEYKKASEQARSAAKAEGADKQADFKAQWADFETGLLGQAYEIHVLRQNPLREADVQKSYNDFKNFYQGTSEIQLGEIVTENQADADKALRDLNAKKSFAAVARQYSADPAAKENGGIGADYIPLKDLEQANPEVYQAVRNLNKGQFTRTPLSNGNVYALFYVNDKRAVKIPSFDEAKNNIAQTLQLQKIAASVEALYQKAKIVPAN